MVEITLEQRANLCRVATFLRQNREEIDFSMSNFAVTRGNLYVSPNEASHKCGATCCAVGWGPRAGVEALPGDFDWGRYAERAFGVEVDDYGTPVGPLWNALFDAAWEHVDNTALGAAERIERFLDTGHLDNPRGW